MVQAEYKGIGCVPNSHAVPKHLDYIYTKVTILKSRKNKMRLQISNFILMIF